MEQPQVTGVAVPQQDVDAIVGLVAAVEKAQQAAAPEDFLTHFRPDAIWTTAHGKLLVGLEEIAAFTRAVLPPTATAPVTASYDVAHILFIRPDLAAVKVRQRPLSRADGRHLDEIFRGHPDPAALAQEHPEARPGNPTYVLAKDDGAWRIAAAQNTTVQDPETLAARP
ncbi:SgcJ/EcaC family oxidoreductase [Kitasatospora sp. NPDC004289]